MAPEFSIFFFFNDTPTTEIYTLSLHDALPISDAAQFHRRRRLLRRQGADQLVGRRAVSEPCHFRGTGADQQQRQRSEEHTSELQSRQYLVCRLLLAKKKTLP